MVRLIAQIACVLAGLLWLLALADRRAWTEPLWAKVLPQNVLPHRPSPGEARVAVLEQRLAAITRQLAEVGEPLAASGRKRSELVKQLHQQLREQPEKADPAKLQDENPIAFALVRSVDAEDQRETEGHRKVADLQKQRGQLEAELIATSNGLSLADPEGQPGPADELRAEMAGESTEIRFGRIIREAASSN